jgi:uncharacterized protein YjiS (DUF1127 family)
MPSLPAASRLAAAYTGGRRLVGYIQQVLIVWARARTAAQRYEELHALSDAALAQRGLRRADIPRAAFDQLVDGRKGR